MFLSPLSLLKKKMPDIDNFKGEEFVLAHDPKGLTR